MRPVARLIWGALVGAFLAVLAYGPTRDTLLWPFRRESADALRPPSWTGRPTSLTEAAEGVELFARRARRWTPRERGDLRRLARRAAQEERGNGFWLQILAASGDPAANRAWAGAARRPSWNSYSAALAERRRQAIRKRLGTEAAWTNAYVVLTRRTDAAEMIGAFSRRLLSRAGMSDSSGVQTRLATARNGDRMRRGGRTIAEGRIGVEMATLAGYPPDLVGVSRPKRLLVGQAEVVDALRREGRADAAEEVGAIFRESASWTAYAGRTDAAQDQRDLTFQTLGVTLSPGLGLLTAVLGALVLSVAKGAAPWLTRVERFPKTPVVGAAVVIAAASFAVLRDLFTGLVLGGAVFALLLQPRRVRSRASASLGPLFSLTVRGLALLAALMLGVSLAERSVPARALLPLTDWPVELSIPETYAGVALLLSALLLLTVPTWAFAQRVPAPLAALALLRRAGATLLGLGLLGTVVGASAALWAESGLNEVWDDLLRNENGYYLRP